MPSAPKPATPPVGAMNALRFQQTRVVNLTNLVMVHVPQFAQDQSDLLHRDQTATVHTLDQKQWVTLAGWLDAEHAVVQCRRSGLTVKVNRKDKMTAALLPLGDGFPKASLLYTVKGGKPQQAGKLETNLNVDSGALVMALRFTSGDVYDEVFSAMTAQPADIRIEISYSHSYQVQSSASSSHVPAQPPVKTQAAV